jgi:antitoxin component of MazEF toxin-antitoxin module
MKEIYAIQPYQVGSNKSKSLAVILPKKITKEWEIDQSTIFSLKVDKKSKILILKSIKDKFTNKNRVAVDKSSLASNQQLL